MNNRMKSMIAAGAAGLALVMAGGVPASAAPGRFEVDLYNPHNELISNLHGDCPALGAPRRVYPLNPSTGDASTHYIVRRSPCKLTIFETQNGTGRGVGLQRDGRKYGLGAVAGNANSIVAYGQS